MKTIIHDLQAAHGNRNRENFTAGRKLKILLATLLAAGASWFTAQATPVFHGISAANINVQQNDTNNTAASITLTTPVEINDFRVINGTQSSRADYFIQIGASATDDVTNGILISSIADNGRDNHEGDGTNWGTPAIDSNPGSPGTPGTSGQYWIPVFGTSDDTNYPEYNFDVSGAYFPYSNGWYGGWIVNTTAVNNGVTTNIATDKLWANPNMVLGTDVIPLGGGKVQVDLRRFGFDSRSNAILLCVGGKNEENFADSQTNTDGTWMVTCRDDATGSGEGDPVGFVCVPMSNHMIVAGRFMGDGSVIMSNAPFTATTTLGGIYHLTIPGVVPGHGVLIISGEEGGSVNGDNIVSYQATATGWDIQTRDVGTGNARPNLQALPAGDAVVSFVYIPAPTAGFTITPTNGLATTESGGTASFTVMLDAPPSAEVDVNLSSSDPTAGTPSATSLAFLPSNWNVPQTVTVTGLNNSSSSVEPYTINFSTATSTDTNYNGFQPPSVSLVNVPSGSPGIFLVPTTGLVTTAGGTATFQVLVNVQPTSDVTIGFSSSDTTQGTVSPTSVTINSGNWTTPQVVTVTGVDDGIVNGNISYQIIGAAAVSSDPNYSNLAVGNVSVLNIDNDVAGVNFNVARISATEGGTSNFTAVLAAKPVANVVLHLATDDPTDGTVAPATLTFTPANFNVPQTITLSGLNDSAINANATYNITTTVSSTAVGYSNLVVSDLPATTIKAVGLPAGTTVYGLGMPPVGIDGLATVNQAIDFSGATLTFALTANSSTNDVLSVRSDGTSAGLIGVSGSTISYGGSTIGTFTGGHGTTPLVATIQSGAPAVGVQGLIEAVVFSTTTTNNFATRTLKVTLTFGSSGVSTVSKGIRVGLLRVTQYQDGADYGYGVYNGESDVEISQVTSGASFPSGSNPANGLFVQLNTSSSDHQVLLRFDNLIGTGSNQIPPGAIIVSADLNLNLVNSGDGFALNRMLIPWDANSASWSTFSDQFGNNGIGVVADDFTAKSNYFSQLGMFTETAGPNGSTLYNTTATGVGNVTIGVTPDVQAWANGDNNNGWVCDAEGVLDAAGNQPWLNLTDGTGFSPSEDPIVANHPRLRVYWLPAGTAGTSFQFGANGYSNVVDCTINQATPNTPNFRGATAFCDAADLGQLDQVEVLMEFTNIFGAAAGQIPANAHIEVAMLNLSSQGSSAAVGDGGRFFALLQPWQDTTTTWNSWSTNGILNDGVQAAITPTATAGLPALVPNVQGGFHSFEVTPDVQNWASGALPNNGWGIVPWPGGADGWGIDMSESANQTNRPQLVVYYTPGTASAAQPRLSPQMVVSGSQVQVTFTGTIGTTYTVSRSGFVKGTYSSIGTATVGAGGTATFTDNSPLPGAAFYRVSFP